MRGFGLRLAGLSAAVLLLTCWASEAAAQAGTIGVCRGPSGCLIAGGSIFADYAVPSDGHSYVLDFKTDAAHPNAIVTLSSPNEVFGLNIVSNGDGTTHYDFSSNLDAPYSWIADVKPGETAYHIWGGAQYNDCNASTPLGQVCGVSYNVWGNGSTISVNTTDPVRVYFTSAMVPEPATWALAIVGFGLSGQMLRRARTSRGTRIA